MSGEEIVSTYLICRPGLFSPTSEWRRFLDDPLTSDRNDCKSSTPLSTRCMNLRCVSSMHFRNASVVA